jgi:hypothetical protein
VRVTYLKGDDANQDATDEEDERDDEPDDAPHFFFFFEICEKRVLAISTHSLKIKRYWVHLVKGNSHRSSRRLMHQKHLLSGR